MFSVQFGFRYCTKVVSRATQWNVFQIKVKFYYNMM